ncbi:MAG: transcription antiterminator [Clostridium sartagoforme]|nr:transcription antiterminator [Clostridium sartagoforme]
MVISDREKQILDSLLNKNRVIKGEELCTGIGVSSRTIRSDIKELNDALKGNGAKIISEKGKGYLLEISNKKVFEVFLNEFNNSKNSILTIRERAEYIIDRLILNEIKGIDGIIQIDLADELFVSLSSLKNDIKLSKNILLGTKLDIIKNSNKGIAIFGKEDDIRKYILKNLKDNKVFLDRFMEIIKTQLGKDSITKIKESLMNNLKMYNLRLTDIAFNNLLNLIYIMIIRNLNNKIVNYDSNTIESLNKEDKIEISKSICNDLEKTLNIKLSIDGVYFITKYIISSNLIVNEVINNGIKDNCLDNKLISGILDEINKLHNIDLSKDSILINFLDNHLSAAINRAKYEIQIENNMLTMIKNKYPFAFELGVLANEIIERNINLSLCEDDIGFLTLHFAAALERLKGNEVKKKRVILVCTTGVGTSLLLKVKLERRFKDNIDIVDTISCYEFNEGLLNDVDLIISTIPLDINSKKVVFIKNLLDKNELKLIEEYIFESNTTTINILDVFKEDLFIKPIDGDDKYEIIDGICDYLINLNYINKKTKEEIIKREKLASTEIGDLVAIPHTMHEGIEKSFIAVAILKKAITWEKEKVQIVFLVGISKKDQIILKSLLEQIYKKILDYDLTLELIKSNGFEDFMKKLE